MDYFEIEKNDLIDKLNNLKLEDDINDIMKKEKLLMNIIN